MRKILSAILLFAMFIPQGMRAEEKNDSVSALQIFVKNNPNCYSKNILYEGCQVLLCSDGESLLIQFKVLHPAIQMRVLMQGMTVYIDPTGRKKEKYSIILPAAKDVREQMRKIAPQRRRADDMQMERPDIKPLVQSLSRYGAIWDINGKSNFIAKECFSIDLEQTDESLIYSVLVPIAQMLEEKKLSDEWHLGLYSPGGRPDEEGPAFNGKPGSILKPRSKRQSDAGHITDVDEDMRDMLMKDIDTWIHFSFSRICSLNN